MARFASLSSSPDRVKAKLQAALFHARRRNRKEGAFGENQIINGDFPVDLHGWFQQDGTDITITHESGRMRIARGSGGVVSFPYQKLFFIPGRTYRLQLDVFLVSTSVRIGSTPGSGNILGNNENVGAVSRDFLATRSFGFLSFWPVNNSQTSEVDNITLRGIA